MFCHPSRPHTLDGKPSSCEGVPSRHPGQGTADRRFDFVNAMIESATFELRFRVADKPPQAFWEAARKHLMIISKQNARPFHGALCCRRPPGEKQIDVSRQSPE